MKIQIPDNFMGKPIKGSIEKVLAGAVSPQQQTTAKPIGVPLNIAPNVKSMDYIAVPQYDIFIAKEVSLKGKNWQDTHYELGDNGLFMPRIDHLTAHFLNVKDAAEGKRTLYDGDNNPINLNEAKELWDYFSSTKNRSKGVCWTWLDALFKKDSQNKMYMETDHRVVLNNTQKSLVGKDVSLDDYFGSNEWATLDFNNQGLATKPSQHNGYVQGENIYFWQPIKDRVAGFLAGSDWAYLYCDGGPAVTDSSLGVFPCAEGTSNANK